MGDDCGTGVAFTRDPATGENGLFGEFLTNAQGEDVVAGVRTPMHISEMEEKFPEAFKQFKEVCKTLETPVSYTHLSDQGSGWYPSYLAWKLLLRNVQKRAADS